MSGTTSYIVDAVDFSSLTGDKIDLHLIDATLAGIAGDQRSALSVRRPFRARRGSCALRRPARTR